jgi:pyruvate/2-oxoglutarate dehydrogenase complex dihydrolipoamide acyltransferase (E2) component
MIYKISVPSVGEDVEEIRVLEWHGAPGHNFVPGDLIVEMETHKALVEVRAGQTGILRSIVTAEGDWAKLGVPIAFFSDTADEALGDNLDASADLAIDFVVD